MRVQKLSILSIFIILLLAACQGETESSATGDAEYTIRNPIIVSEDNFVAITMKKFEELVEEKTEGRIEVENYYNGTLGASDEEALQLVFDGNAEIFGMSSFVGAQATSVDGLNIFDIPFLFENRDELYEFVDSPVAEDIFTEFEEETNTKIFGTYDIGFYGMLNNSHPIEEPNDLNGLTLRTPQSSMYMDLVEELGGNPSPITQAEVYSALQQGTIDGLMTTLPLMHDYQYHELGQHITVTAHSYVPYILTMNGDFYNSLPVDLQEAVEEAAQEMLEWSINYVEEEEKEAIEKMKEEGTEVIELTTEQRHHFFEEVQPVIEKNIDSVGVETYEKVLDSLDK
ncbi:TRAP transporter substrate-binding protein [Virgibacillus sediminis]|uniref:TRAP transporter substrate-binding protein n=1 Tax=Virgibacillus sediminis TaxID=202260 RepID=A0ABV7A4X8_9BACI